MQGGNAVPSLTLSALRTDGSAGLWHDPQARVACLPVNAKGCVTVGNHAAVVWHMVHDPYSPCGGRWQVSHDFGALVPS
jgi:hypothetical protein